MTTGKNLVQSSVPVPGVSCGAGTAVFVAHTTTHWITHRHQQMHGGTPTHRASTAGTRRLHTQKPCAKSCCQTGTRFFDVDAWTECLTCSRSFPEHEHQDLEHGVLLKTNVPKNFAKQRKKKKKVELALFC